MSTPSVVGVILIPMNGDGSFQVGVTYGDGEREDFTFSNSAKAKKFFKEIFALIDQDFADRQEEEADGQEDQSQVA